MAEKLTGWSVPKETYEERPEIPDNQKLRGPELQELYEKFNSNADDIDGKLSTVSTDGTTITGDGTPEDPLVATTGGGGDMTKAVYDPQDIEGDAFDRSNHTGTQTASTISDFDSAVSSSSNVSLNTANRIVKIALNSVASLFGFNNGDFTFRISTTNSIIGKISGAVTSYWETIDSGGVKTIFKSSDSELPETDGDYTSGITPALSGNKIITYRAVNPSNLEITTTDATLDSNYSNSNGDIYYNNAIGGDLTIEDDLLEVNQVARVFVKDTGVCSFLAGVGVTLTNKDSAFTASGQYANILISKTGTGEYNLAGDLS